MAGKFLDRIGGFLNGERQPEVCPTILANYNIIAGMGDENGPGSGYHLLPCSEDARRLCGSICLSGPVRKTGSINLLGHELTYRKFGKVCGFNPAVDAQVQKPYFD